MRFKQLNEWLAWLETLHPRVIDLGLDRVLAVAKPLALNQFSCPVITVAGTNGKGSTVAALEAIYKTAGYRVGSYTSPHLLLFNERIRINGEAVNDELICETLAKIDEWRGVTTLTYFEFTTLAAFYIFQQAQLDVVLLEVGLGGRLDAVNCVDADIAIITSIELDHQDWLGDNREKIGREKAGILRLKRALIFGQADMPESVKQYATQLQCPIYQYGQQFYSKMDDNICHFTLPNDHHLQLSKPQLCASNLACAMMAVELLQSRLPVSDQHIITALTGLTLAGRIQQIKSNPQWLVDVAHNPHAVQHLANYLREHAITGHTYALFSMLADKDIGECLRLMHDVINAWCIVPLDVARAMSLPQLQTAFSKATIDNVLAFATMAEAHQHLQQVLKAHDRVIVFGSFYTVANALTLRV